MFVYLSFGGLEGDRTLDLRVANAALSQLSYEPIFDFQTSVFVSFTAKFLRISALLCEPLALSAELIA